MSKDTKVGILLAALSITVFGGLSWAYYAKSEEAPKAAVVKAVMYEFEYDLTTLEIKHAQVVGGWPSDEACKDAMPKVLAMATPGLEPNTQMELQCSTVHSHPAQEDPKS